jgi:hypothetical protein
MHEAVFREMTRDPLRYRRFYLQGLNCTPGRFVEILREAEAWCTDQFGNPGAAWDRCKYGPDQFKFHDDTAACVFKMRWC